MTQDELARRRGLSFLGMAAVPALTLARPVGLAVATGWAVLLVGLGSFATARRDSRPFAVARAGPVRTAARAGWTG